MKSKPSPAESCSQLGETGVSENHMALLGFDLAHPELRHAFDLGRARGAMRMSELLYKIAAGERSEGSLAACKYFLANVVGWQEEASPPPQWKPTLVDMVRVLEEEGVMTEMRAWDDKCRAEGVCPTCQRLWPLETLATVAVPAYNDGGDDND